MARRPTRARARASRAGYSSRSRPIRRAPARRLSRGGSRRAAPQTVRLVIEHAAPSPVATVEERLQRFTEVRKDSKF